MLKTVLIYARMIKFSHTLFALPFTLASATLAFHTTHFNAIKLFWILLAMLGARSAAMGFNRFVDKNIDEKNPRTQMRALPQGNITPFQTGFIIIFFCLLFIFSSFQLNHLCGILSFPTLIIILGYSYTKRFTWLSHFILGLALALAPIGTWIGVTGSWNTNIFFLGLAVLLWVAGFDCIYACQDLNFDRESKYFSIPARFGLKKTLQIAILSHLCTWLLFLYIGTLFSLNIFYYLGCLLIGGILIYEHRIIGPHQLEQIQIAFFKANASVSMLYLIMIFIGVR